MIAPKYTSVVRGESKSEHLWRKVNRLIERFEWKGEWRRHCKSWAVFYLLSRWHVFWFTKASFAVLRHFYLLIFTFFDNFGSKIIFIERVGCVSSYVTTISRCKFNDKLAEARAHWKNIASHRILATCTSTSGCAANCWAELSILDFYFHSERFSHDSQLLVAFDVAMLVKTQYKKYPGWLLSAV